jgi:hypothetical protein
MGLRSRQLLGPVDEAELWPPRKLGHLQTKLENYDSLKPPDKKF